MRRLATKEEKRRRWLPAVGLGALLQIPLLGLFMWQTHTSDLDRPVDKEADRLRGRIVALSPAKEPEPDEILDRQIVEVPEDSQEAEETPVRPKYQADRKVRVNRQTRSRRRTKPSSNRGNGRVKVESKSTVQSRRSQNSAPTSLPNAQDQIAMLKPSTRPNPRTESDRGRRSPLFEGAESRLLLPSTSSKNALANIQALDGSFASDDYLPDEEDGESTLLNADKYKFADYFYRIKEAVRGHWHPASVYRTRDPSGKVYGVKDRHTVLKVTLDSKGSVISILTRQASGLEFLDQEARDAFRRAQPFSNPPLGLIKDGEIHFSFGFYFEISSGYQGFRWKRL